MTLAAFLFEAFQSGAFQSEAETEVWAFQQCAFQADAFQADVCPEPVDDEEIIWLGGNWYQRRQRAKATTRYARDFDFLDPEYHKKRLAPKVKKVINKIARQAVQKTTQDAPKEAQESPVASDWVDSLITLLERENIAFKRFYADLLQQQIEEQRNAQIRLQLELLGIYQQIEEEDEQAIMLMMMEL